MHDICQVSGTRWGSASQVNPSTAYTINIPNSSYVYVKQNTTNISGINVRLIRDSQYVTVDTPTTYNGAEFAIPTHYQNVSAAAIYKGWFYRSGNYSASTPKTINLSVPIASTFKVKKNGAIATNKSVAIVNEAGTQIISNNAFSDGTGTLLTNSSGQVEFAIPAGTRFYVYLPTEGKLVGSGIG